MDFDIWSTSATQGELYDPAMEVQTKEEAAAYFKKLQDMMTDVHPDISEKIIKANLGYWAAYGDSERRERVERLYDCEHPIFGRIAELGRPSTDEAFQLGCNRAKGEGPQNLATLRASKQ